MKRDYFRLEPYGVVVKVHRKLPRKVLQAGELSPQTCGLTWRDEKDEFLINVWISDNLQPKYRTLIVVHESVHIKQLIEEAVCTKMDCETEAYTVQELADKILQKVGFR